MYSYIKEKCKYCCKAKGIKKNVVAQEIKHKNYLDTIFCVDTYEVNKIGLSCYDDKKYILDDGISTLAYGHYMIPSENCPFKPYSYF